MWNEKSLNMENIQWGTGRKKGRLRMKGLRKRLHHSSQTDNTKTFGTSFSSLRAFNSPVLDVRPFKEKALANYATLATRVGIEFV